MHNFIEDVAEFLINEEVIASEALFIAVLPPEPDNALLIVNTGGVEPDRDVPIAQPTVQMTIRNTDYNTGEALGHQLFELLHGRQDTFNLKDGGADVMHVYALQEPTFIGQDSESRYLFTINFVFMVRR